MMIDGKTKCRMVIGLAFFASITVLTICKTVKDTAQKNAEAVAACASSGGSYLAHSGSCIGKEHTFKEAPIWK